MCVCHSKHIRSDPHCVSGERSRKQTLLLFASHRIDKPGWSCRTLSQCNLGVVTLNSMWLFGVTVPDICCRIRLPSRYSTSDVPAQTGVSVSCSRQLSHHPPDRHLLLRQQMLPPLHQCHVTLCCSRTAELPSSSICTQANLTESQTVSHRTSPMCHVSLGLT